VHSIGGTAASLRARFQAVCVASSWFWQNGVVLSHPAGSSLSRSPAGNLSHWVANTEKREKHFKESKRMASERIGKYACLEVECRYLLSKIPDDLLDRPKGWLITDRYFPDTRLRLRHMQSLSGDEHIYKLTQKYRSETQNAYETTITNMYLTEAEYNHFETLEAKILKKKRYPYALPNVSLSIDVFEGRHQGLILAEMELEKKAGVNELALPSFILKDVTEDPFFTGGNLVTMTDVEFKQGLSQRLRDPRNLINQNAT
jgi:CYTH domain-containing protein